MEKHHLRRDDRELTNGDEIDRILTTRPYVTVAACRDGEPYLVVLTHGYDAGQRRLYFHCAADGKKIDFMKANPRVWGIAVEDLGYLDGACDHAYRTAMFGGLVGFVEDEEEKRRALELMIGQRESDPERVKAALLEPRRIGEITIGRIDIEQISGKQSLPEGD